MSREETTIIRSIIVARPAPHLLLRFFGRSFYFVLLAFLAARWEVVFIMKSALVLTIAEYGEKIRQLGHMPACMRRHSELAHLFLRRRQHHAALLGLQIQGRRGVWRIIIF